MSSSQGRRRVISTTQALLRGVRIPLHSLIIWDRLNVLDGFKMITKLGDKLSRGEDVGLKHQGSADHAEKTLALGSHYAQLIDSLYTKRFTTTRRTCTGYIDRQKQIRKSSKVQGESVKQEKKISCKLSFVSIIIQLTRHPLPSPTPSCYPCSAPVTSPSPFKSLP